MSAIKQIITESKKRVDVDEFLRKALARAGYGGVEIAKTPLGTRVTLYVVKPGLVIGRGGESIKNLARNLEEKFGLSNPQIAVAEVPVPELNPHIMASKIAAALERGVHFRRACYWALTNIMDAGALGAEIVIGGKLTTERARHEKFKAGYLPKVGDSVLKKIPRAVVYTLLKQGLFGVQVTIVPPDYKSPDQIEIKESPPATVAAPPSEEAAAAAEKMEEAKEEETVGEETEKEPKAEETRKEGEA
ncbi:30S ribosomal protein S3 [Candidatus Hecatella orcuttiae]|jgi:small subunit ribosomal protein S3|uniref:30S ribosomal protein S3 n=1 Tax=Candidatus Hecatella orcuttiae TaxID=1935119 RepID=UPI002867D596|nr:30S ribosomal protein S3 [Candidatus Hecatella orcuttiae]